MISIVFILAVYISIMIVKMRWKQYFETDYILVYQGLNKFNKDCGQCSWACNKIRVQTYQTIYEMTGQRC